MVPAYSSSTAAQACHAADTGHDTPTRHSIQWNPSCEATPFAGEMWPSKRGGLSSGVEINTFMFRFTVSIGLSRGVGLSSGWPHKRGFTV